MTAQSNDNFWFDTLQSSSGPFTEGPVPAHTDVAIIGAGYTGLWIAYYLKKSNPDLDISVFEANTVGFGASGRNGGWCFSDAYGTRKLLRKSATRQAGIELSRALFDTVDEVKRVCDAEGIDCQYAKGGALIFANTEFEEQYMEKAAAFYTSLGFDPLDLQYLPPEEAAKRMYSYKGKGAVYIPHSAVLNPAELVVGLANVAQRMGVRIYEQTPVVRITKNAIETSKGTVKASTIIRATEGYTDSIKGHKRQLMPLYSMIVATEPIPADLWNEIGLANRESFTDTRKVIIYGHRTQDDRMVFGGRGSYYFGSERKAAIDPRDPSFELVEKQMRTFFPMLSGIKVTHRWGGLMGMTRHRRPFVKFDRQAGYGVAGGYVGSGVAAANLAARIMTDLVQEQETELTSLHWVNDMSRRWEPEPLRWLGVKFGEQLGERADRVLLQKNKYPYISGTLFDWLKG